MVAADGTVLFFNKECERLFGCPSEQIVGRSVTSLLQSTDQDPAADDPAACVGRLRARRGVRMRARDGREFPAELSISATSTAAGQQYLIVVRTPASEGDDPRAGECEAELTRTARLSAFEEIGSALVHRLNQPLTAVILYLQAVERAYRREMDGRPLPDKVASILDKAVHEAERASGMLQGMRHVRDGDGPQFADVNQAVEDAIDLAGFRARQGSHIDRLLTPRLPPVPVDRAELQQALISLIRGALDEARGRRSGGIRLTTGCGRGHVAVVAETACGGEIDGNCALSTNGRRNCEKELAVARAIARSHGGDLVVDADGRDRGARFTLRLPLPAGSVSSA